MSTSRFQRIVKRDGAVVPFTPLRITNAIYRAAIAVGGRDQKKAEELTDKVIAFLDRNLAKEMPHVEDVQDAIEKVLIEDGHARTAKAFILYRDERARHRAEVDKSGVKRTTEFVPWEKIWRVLNWSIDHRVATVWQLNARITEGSFPDLVRESEEAYSLDIVRAADAILRRRHEVRVVIVAGPSSSGKTTTTIKISEHLKNEGFDFVPFHVDDYFHDLDAHPTDEFGDHDYETPQALNLDMLNADLEKLLKGEEIIPPKFNYKAGKCEPGTKPMRLGPQQILLIDSLHGLFDGMTGSVPAENKFRLYIEPLLQMRGADGSYLRWTDLRLIRRIVRDQRCRNVTPTQTLEHWHYVRSAELRHIVPFVSTVDYIVNGSLSYELPIWSARMRDLFAGWVKAYADNPLKQDAHHRATRVFQMLDAVTPWTDESVIPDDALLREFIGGSKYKY